MFDIAARKSLYLKGRTSALLPRHPVGPSQRQVCSRFSGRFGPRFRGAAEPLGPRPAPAAPCAPRCRDRPPRR